MDQSGQPASLAKPPDNQSRAENDQADGNTTVVAPAEIPVEVEVEVVAEGAVPQEQPAGENVQPAEQRAPQIEKKLNFPKCPDMALLPPRLTRKSKYVKENPKQENLFMYLLASFVVVFREIKKENFGLTLPRAKEKKKLRLANIVETFTELKDDIFRVPNFVTDKKESIKFKHLIEKINEGGNEGYNCLDCEITKKPSLNKQVRIPSIVNGYSMVAELKKVINDRLKEIGGTQKATGNTKVLQSLKQEKAELTRVLSKLPSYEKFFIYSMKDAFTNLHVDFGGTFVYYYVMEGSKVFWIAPPTERNLEVYKRLETKRQNIWEYEQEFLMSEFERHELHAGDLAFIPTGYLHFVYTPAKSLVFGGNFLTLNKLEQHFEITRFEEECKVKAEKYKLFWDFQFAYVKYVWLAEVKWQRNLCGAVLPKECLNIGQTFLNALQNEIKEEEGGIYTSEEKSKIVKEIKTALRKGTPKIGRMDSEDDEEPKIRTIEDIDAEIAAKESKRKLETPASSSDAKRPKTS